MKFEFERNYVPESRPKADWYDVKGRNVDNFYSIYELLQYIKQCVENHAYARSESQSKD